MWPGRPRPHSKPSCPQHACCIESRSRRRAPGPSTVVISVPFTRAASIMHDLTPPIDHYRAGPAVAAQAADVSALSARSRGSSRWPGSDPRHYGAALHRVEIDSDLLSDRATAAAPRPTPRRATADRPYLRRSGVGEMPAGRCACGPRRCRAALAWCRCAAPPAGARARRRISPPAPGFASSGSRSPLGLWRPRATYRKLEIFVRQAASGRLRGRSGRRASAANVPIGGHVAGAR
jgi:hypothetical protein